VRRPCRRGLVPEWPAELAVIYLTHLDCPNQRFPDKSGPTEAMWLCRRGLVPDWPAKLAVIYLTHLDCPNQRFPDKSGPTEAMRLCRRGLVPDWPAELAVIYLTHLDCPNQRFPDKSGPTEAMQISRATQRSPKPAPFLDQGIGAVQFPGAVGSVADLDLACAGTGDLVRMVATEQAPIGAFDMRRFGIRLHTQ
jgi:hypothetical protein